MPRGVNLCEVSRTAGNAIWQLQNCMRYTLTYESQAEKGSPLSRAKAKVCRDVEARELIVIMISRIRTTITTAVVPPTVPKAFW